MITVKDVWRSVLPQDTELLGGGGGLERRVEWATALRTRPPAFDSVKGGEMAFIPVRSIRLLDERLDLAQVMESFAEKGGVAVAVVGDVEAAAITVADRMLLPLLKLPAATHVADVQQTTVRYILDQRTLLHERQQELHTQLVELALAGAGVGAIIERLAGITGATAAWQDATGHVEHAAPADAAGVAEALERDVDAVRRWAESTRVVAADPPVHEFAVGSGALARLVAPVPVRGGIGGFVSLVAPEGRLDQVARLAVARSAAACAIELDRERAVLKARDELEGEFLEALLTGTYASEAAVRQRAERLGFDLSGSTVVFAVRADPGPEVSPRLERERLVLGGQGWVRRRAPGALVLHRQGSLAVVLPIPAGEPDPELRRLASDLRMECSGALHGPTSVGVGRPKPGIAGVRISHREAEQALGMGRRIFGGARVTHFGELGLHRVLFAMQVQPELREFFDDQVGPLVEYDRRSGAGLMATLEAFFRCHGSPTEIAQALHLHRNTVLYRLRRIEEIGRLRLDDPDTRLNLHLCLRIRDVLQAPV